MKLCSYRVDGHDLYGVLTDDGIVDLTRRIGKDYPTLVSCLRGGAVPRARDAAAHSATDFAVDDVEFLPLTAEPVNIFCVGVNYLDHQEETGRTGEAFPSAFAKYRESLVGHNQPLVRPTGLRSMDFEVEYAVVIGAPARNVSREEALDYVAGYTILNDGTIREYQYERGVFQGKNFWRTGACGPCMVTSDAALPWEETELRTWVNGQIMQESTVDRLIMDVPFLVSYFSRQTLLKPGDMIATGTPAGVGHRRDPPAYLKPGDVVEMEITGIGKLRNPVIDEADSATA